MPDDARSGPISTGTNLILGGLWSTYFNGAVCGSEIAHGFDVWRLAPTPELSQNEIDAAAEVHLEPDAPPPAANRVGAKLRRCPVLP